MLGCALGQIDKTSALGYWTLCRKGKGKACSSSNNLINSKRVKKSCSHVCFAVTTHRPHVKKKKYTDKELEARVRTYSASSTSSDSADDLDTGLSLVDDEALALKLLTS